MSGFMCCMWWFLFGILLGWLLSWLFDKWFGRREVVNPIAVNSASAVVSSTTAGNSQSLTPVVSGFSAAAALAAGIKVKGLDDLEIIEGIGPKIDELFKQNGVQTFDAVSKLSVAEMSAILEKGGPRFKLANPETWAEQARLANEGRWAELKALQDVLYGGTTIKPDNNA